MDSYVVVRYLHFLGIFLVVGALSAEHLMVKSFHQRQELKKIANVDGVYGIGSIIVVIAGLLMWFSVGKPAEFYTYNWIFYLKISMFVVVGLLSIWPTVFFMKNRKGPSDEVVQVPSAIRLIIKVESAIVLLIPLLAVLMAMGIGSYQ